MADPFFSVVISAYNRSAEVARCVRSCTAQTFEDFEIVVVDDGSTDDTEAVLGALPEPRLRVVRHERNRGISPARATAVAHARGEWLVVLDSDWDMYPHTLARLRELIDTLPPDVHIIRSRLKWDAGTVDPEIMPATALTGYRGRLEWLEAVYSTGSSADAGHCIHRSVFEATPYIERRGPMEGLWELDVARSESSLWVSEVLGRQYGDAANSHSRVADASGLIPQLLGEAADVSWMVDTMLAEHGAALSQYAPHCWRKALESAALQALLAGRRRAGARDTLAAIRAGSSPLKTSATLALGLIGPRALAYAKLGGRRWRASRPVV
jgi:hypothetical protein